MFKKGDPFRPPPTEHLHGEVSPTSDRYLGGIGIEDDGVSEAGEAREGDQCRSPSTERLHREISQTPDRDLGHTGIQDDGVSEAQSLIVPTSLAPLYDQLLENLANSDQPNVLRTLADKFSLW